MTAAGPDAAVRFEFAELAYGCHRRRFEFPDGGEPVVLVGPNGAGKTTVVEALVRALYGFNRQRQQDRELVERRRPWRGEGYRVTLGLSGPEGRVTLEREFDTDRVRLLRQGEEKPLFDGEANPAASGEEIRRYRALLAGLVGLPDREAWERTTCIRQGALLDTRLSEELLQLAAGGHADVEKARSSIRDGYYGITKEAIGPDERSRGNPAALERAEERVRGLEAAREEARRAERRRRPLAEERDATRGRLTEVEDEVRRLEEAADGLGELESVQARLEAGEVRLERLEDARRMLDEALARLDLAEARPDVPEQERYPDDFPARAAALEEGLWPRTRELEAEREELERAVERAPEPREPPTGAALAGGALLAVGTLVAVVLAPAWVAAGLGVAAVAAAGWAVRERRRRARALEELGARRARVRESLAEVASRIEDRLADVPDADTLSPQTLPDRRREHERQGQEARFRREARDAVRSAMDRAREALRDAGGEEREAAVRSDETLARRARERLDALRAAAEEERGERLAPLRLELRRLSRAQFDLPADVARDAEDVREALRRRREEASDLRADLNALDRRLAYEGRPPESSAALAERIEEARGEVDRLRARAAAYRHAHALVRDAYEEFRQGDQARLLGEVSARLEGATGGELGPVEAPDGLESARVRAGERSLPLESPPLSYGQLHSATFAVRLGVADFLADLGVRPPLLVDDPFVTLDEHRAAALWGVLRRVARERQVLVATQDRLLLEHLGVEPDFRLRTEAVADLAGAGAAEAGPGEGRAAREGAGAEPDGGGPEAPDRGPARRAERPPEPEEEAPDLWSSV